MRVIWLRIGPGGTVLWIWHGAIRLIKMRQFLYQLGTFQHLKQYTTPWSLLVVRTSRYSFCLKWDLWRRYRTTSCCFSEKSLPFCCDVIRARIILADNKRNSSYVWYSVFKSLFVFRSLFEFWDVCIALNTEHLQLSVIFFEHPICHIKYSSYLQPLLIAHSVPEYSHS
jgi:hypothetical protein